MMAQKRTQSTLVLCVHHWQQSPFVAINPNRTALVGRSFSLAPQVTITRDFARQVTTIAI